MATKKKPARKAASAKGRVSRKKSPARKMSASAGRAATRKRAAKASSRKPAKRKAAAAKKPARKKVAAGKRVAAEKKVAAGKKVAARKAAPRTTLPTQASRTEDAPVKAPSILPSATRTRTYEPSTSPSFLEPTKPPSVTPVPSFGFASPSMEPAEPEEE